MRKLYRSRTTRVIGGVAAGLAEYLDIDVTVMRLLFVLAAVLIPNVVLAYLLAWIIIPEAPLGYVVSREAPKPAAPDTGASASEFPKGLTADEILGESPNEGGSAPVPVTQTTASTQGRDTETQRAREFFGYVLIVVGGFFLARQFLPQNFWRLPYQWLGHWWPAVIIVAGLALIVGAIKGR